MVLRSKILGVNLVKFFGFLVFGFLIGNLIGLSGTQLLEAVLAALFAFAGGSAIAFFTKLDDIQQKGTSQLVLYLTGGCLLGLYFGIAVEQNQLLGQKVTKSERALEILETAITNKSKGEPGEDYAELVKMFTTMSAEIDRNSGYLRSEELPAVLTTYKLFEDDVISGETAFCRLYLIRNNRPIPPSNTDCIIPELGR